MDTPTPPKTPSDIGTEGENVVSAVNDLDNSLVPGPDMSYQPSKVMIAGDFHGNGAWAQRAIWQAQKNNCDAIVHAGDFGWWTPIDDTHRYLRFVERNLKEAGLHLYWVDGNHEDHSRLNHLGVEPRELNPDNVFDYGVDVWERIHYLPRGFRWTWHDKTWMALGGAHSVDRRYRKEYLSWWREEELNLQQLEYASREGKVDVIIAHDAPDKVLIPGVHASEKLDEKQSMWPPEDIYASNVHRRNIGEVVDAVKADRYYHGHFHVRYDALREGREGWKTQVTGLDCDGAHGEDNWVYIYPELI